MLRSTRCSERIGVASVRVPGALIVSDLKAAADLVSAELEVKVA